jgi:hypothetical protein
MSVIICCPGIHPPEFTQDFISGCQIHSSDTSPNEFSSFRVCTHSLFSDSSNQNDSGNILIFPATGVSVLSGSDILEFLQVHLGGKKATPLIFIGFSAGVVGAIAAAWGWQLQGGHVQAFIAIDGWGVPLFGDFSIHRMSHDYFTHWSSTWPFSGQDNFYADPPVDHLDLWRKPHAVKGWRISSGSTEYLSATEYLHILLKRYTESHAFH